MQQAPLDKDGTVMMPLELEEAQQRLHDNQQSDKPVDITTDNATIDFDDEKAA